MGGGTGMFPQECGEQCRMSIVLIDGGIEATDIESGARLPGSESRLTPLHLL